MRLDRSIGTGDKGMAEYASLTLGNKNYDLQVIKGTTGPDVLDVRKLYADADVFTFDPGFTSTASCESKITYIDGDAGILLHRGYPIEQLAEKSSFLEVCYLLLNGELPSAAEFEDFDHTITYHTMLHAQFDRFFTGFRSDAHPMAIMTGAVGALSAFYHDSINVDDPKQREISAHRLPRGAIPQKACRCHPELGLPGCRFQFPHCPRQSYKGYSTNVRWWRSEHPDTSDWWHS